MSHYDTLGLPVDAPPEAVREAYKILARRLHPDNQSTRTPADRAAAEEAMRDVNAAWAVLGTPEARAAYDRTLGRDPDAVGDGRSYVRPFAAETFVPFDDSDDGDEDEDWRYEPDEGDPRSAPTRSVLAIPLVTGAACVATFFAWMFVTSNALLVAAVALLGATVVGFLLLPVLAMAKAARLEGEHRLRRDRPDAP